MIVQIDRNTKLIDCDKITIEHNECEFRISINKFDEILINKVNFGAGDSGISITPRVSNEILIK